MQSATSQRVNDCASKHLPPEREAMLVQSLRWLALAAACGWTVTSAADVPLGTDTVVRFAEAADGVRALTVRDEFILNLSPFDRQVLLRTDRDVSEAEFLEYLSRHVLPWTAAEIEQLTSMLVDLAKKLAPWKLALPGVVLLVKTDGQECAHAAYCRGAAVVLPLRILRGQRLQQILPHELFHVWSRHNAEARQALYRSIGFERTNIVPLPPALAARKITNPDAPLNNQFITVTQDGRRMELMPILFSKLPRYDVARGGTLFDYLQFKLLALENIEGTRQPLVIGDEPMLFEPANVPGFNEQVGSNTRYLIHPEEILADNFVFLIEGRINLPSPRVVEEMGRILQAAGANLRDRAATDGKID